MAISSINGYSTSRITGLMSNMDTDSMIQKAMQTQQLKLDRMYQQKTSFEWKRDAYTNVNKLLGDFSDKFMSLLSPDNMFSQSTYKVFNVSIGEKYGTYFDIKGTADATASQHKITKSTLAETANINGEKYRNRVAGFTGTSNNNALASVTGTKALQAGSEDMKLSELKYADGSEVFKFASSSDRLSFSVNGKSFVFNQDQKLSDVMSAVSGDPTAKATMKLSADNKIEFASKEIGSKTQLRFANTAGPEVFGKNGAFGIEELNITPKSLINENMTLDEIATATGRDLGFDSNGKISFKINGETFEFDKTDTLKTVTDTVNASSADVTMTYNKDKDIFMIRSKVTGTDTKVKTENVQGNFFGENSLTGIKEDETTKYQTISRTSDTIASAASKMGVDLQLDANNKLTFKVNDVEFSFSASDSLDKMITTINGNKDAKAKLSYSEITDSFVFTSSETGSDAKVKLEGGAGVFGDATSFFGMEEGSARGKDATLVIDGETITRASNTFVLDGIQITLKENFEADNNPEKLGAASFNVTQDTTAVVDKMKTFVTEYNKLMQSLYQMTTESVDYNYSPLTEAQRENMSDEEIKKWETEAKKGVLKNDSTIKNMMTDMRKALNTAVEGTGLSLGDLGITTSKYVTGEYGGQITFDESKFKETLKNNPEGVARAMAGTSTARDKDTEFKESGLITRFFNTVADAKNTIRGKDIKKTNEKITNAEETITNQIKKMYEEQERLYAQFAQMEKLMSQYQSQSNWLMQQLGAGSAG